jgi:hypothetical protein
MTDVWYVRSVITEPQHRPVHRPGADPLVLGPDDLLEGGDLLPGLSLPVSRLVG